MHCKARNSTSTTSLRTLEDRWMPDTSIRNGGNLLQLGLENLDKPYCRLLHNYLLRTLGYLFEVGMRLSFAFDWIKVSILDQRPPLTQQDIFTSKQELSWETRTTRHKLKASLEPSITWIFFRVQREFGKTTTFPSGMSGLIQREPCTKQRLELYLSDCEALLPAPAYGKEYLAPNTNGLLVFRCRG